MKDLNTRVSAKWLRRLVLSTVIAMIMVPTAVIASGGAFVDDDTNIFENDINWMASSGVTLGCDAANNLYCPNDNVTRGQMAAFMHRLAKYLGAEDGTPAQADNATHADDATHADNADALGGVAAVDVLPGGTLPAGSVLRGTLNVGGTAANPNDLATADISYGFDMGSPLSVVVIDAGGTPPDTCPGTANDPAADAGYICIFSTVDANTTLGGDNDSFSFGVTVYTRSDAAGDFYTIANWAATAPGPAPAAATPHQSTSANGS
ncbi:MAG: hypothetical protein WBV06_04210 [Acidimicrobiia bacterium]